MRVLAIKPHQEAKNTLISHREHIERIKWIMSCCRLHQQNFSSELRVEIFSANRKPGEMDH